MVTAFSYNIFQTMIHFMLADLERPSWTAFMPLFFQLKS